MAEGITTYETLTKILDDLGGEKSEDVGRLVTGPAGKAPGGGREGSETVVELWRKGSARYCAWHWTSRKGHRFLLLRWIPSPSENWVKIADSRMGEEAVRERLQD